MSSQTTCINHPSGSHFVVIYDWQVALCEGNTTTAALLSFFERWHNLKLEMRPKNIQSNNVAAAHGDERSQDESTLQFHSEQELIEGIQSIGKRDSVRKSINWLESKGFISIHGNPNKRYAFDKTRYFQFYPDVVNEWLKTGMSINRPPMSKNQSRSSEKQQPSSENTSAITDHTSENTSNNKDPLTPKGGNEPISELKILEGGGESASPLALPTSKIEPIALTQVIVSEVNVPPSAKKPKQDAEFFEPLRAIYNQVKPTTWAECKSFNDKRLRAFKRLYQELGDRTAQTMQEALCFVQHDRWWRETYSSRCIDGLLVSGRVQQLSDSYKAINPDANYNANTGEIGVIDPDTGDRITDPNHIAILKGLGRI